MALVDLFKPRGKNGFGSTSTAELVTEGLDLTGKRVLITGVNSGLGAESARVLSMRGAHILGTARSQEKATAACAPLSSATPLVCELTNLRSVAQCAANVGEIGKPLDVIICNAGVMAPPKLETIEGVERQFFTNHIGHFTLVTKLLDQLSETARVVIVSSYGHTLAPPIAGINFDNLDGSQGYIPFREYGQSKLANILFAFALARRFEGTERCANAIHPGVVDTNLGREMGALDKMWKATKPLYTKSPAAGAATQCYVAAHPDVQGESGAYFADCNRKRCSAKANDKALGERLWTTSEQIVSRVLS